MAVRKFKSNKNNSLNGKPQGKSTIQINRKEKGLVLLDQTVIRKQTLGECHKTLKKIDKAKQEIEQYEKVDKPAYEKWIQENFGELITRIRMHSQEIQEKRALIEEIQEEAFFQRITFIEAFKIIKYRKAHPEEFEKSKAKENEKKENFWEKTMVIGKEVSVMHSMRDAQKKIFVKFVEYLPLKKNQTFITKMVIISITNQKIGKYFVVNVI